MGVRFSGTTQKYDRSTSIPAYSALTMCGWVRVNATPGTFVGCFAIGNLGASHNIYVGTDNGVWCLQSGGSRSALGTSPAVGTVMFMAFTSAAGVATGYRRDRGVDTLTTSGTLSATGTTNGLCIGSTVYDGTDYFNGDVWNVKVWDRVLTPAEILVESYFARPQFPASLNSWYPMPNASDVTDKSSNGRTLTATGTPTTADSGVNLWVPRRRIYLPTGGAAATDINAGQGSLVLAGINSQIILPANVAAGQGSLVLGAVPALVQLATAIPGTVGPLTLGNVQAQIILPAKVPAGQGAIVLGGVQAQVAAATNIPCSTGVLTLGAVPAQVSLATAVNAAPAALLLGGVQAAIAATTRIDCTIGSLQLGTYPAQVTTGVPINCGVGGLQLGAIPAAVVLPTPVNAGQGDLILGGVEAAVDEGAQTDIAADVGGLVLGAVPAQIVLAANVPVAIGPLTLGGIAAQVQLATAVPGGQGAMTLGSVSAQVQLATAINAGVGNLVLGGVPAAVAVTEATVVDCAPGALALGGVTALVTQIEPEPPTPVQSVGSGGGPGGTMPPRRKRMRVAVRDTIEDRAVIVARVTAIITPLSLVAKAARQAAQVADAVAPVAAVLQRAHWPPARARVEAVDDVGDAVLAKVQTSDPDLQAFFDLLLTSTTAD